MDVTNITDFRANVKQYIESVIMNHDALVINRGNTAAVLISLEEYNAIKETERLLSCSDYINAKEGLEAISRNDLITIDIDDL